MAAYASLISLMEVIDDLEHHPSPPISLDKQLVDSITQRITYFEEFLHSYISTSPVADDDEEVADPLEMRIAGAAFAAEDAIEYHIVDCIKKKKKKKKANDHKNAKSLNRCYGILQSVIEEMDSIKKVVEDTQKIKKVSLVHDQVGTTNITASVAARSETFVGSDGVLNEIMEKLIGHGTGKTLQVISIVGMGGIGKTFLAKTIYAEPRIKDRFVICAWATISQHYDPGEILRELLSQATKTNKEQMSGKSVEQLGLDLYQYLFPRRFLIVMDDMWSIDSWNNIRHYFPDNYNGSRVLVTTRLSELMTTDYSFSMNFLDKASSWDLFSKTVFGEKSSCPPELEEIGEKIVDNCKGLPLSISVVGGLLKNMDGTRASWESIRDNFTSVVNMRNDKHCLRLLKLSYNHLPVYLKPCFLYMGVFEEDERIRVSTLVLQWVSEGFLKPTKGEALEITGRGFVQDLVGRNLILIDELGSTGSIKYCKIHDLVRDMCLKEAQKEGFYHVMGKCNPPSPHGMNAQRRVIIHDNTLEEYNVPDNTLKEHGDLRLMSHTRSIISEYGRVPLCKNLVLLRTLQVYDETDLNFVVSRYVNLRHLYMEASWMPPFLPSISHLWNLRTLVVSSSYNFEPMNILVVDFWEMTQLRHMNFSRNYACLPDPPSCDGRDGVAVVIMENLQTLKRISNFKFRNGVVKRIPNIKKLHLKYDDGDGDGGGDDVYFLGNMKYLCGLESLSVKCFLASRPFKPLQKITYPHSLKKLDLMVSREHEWDDMVKKIGSLPLLEKLKLIWGCFKKGKWEIGQGQFPRLKYLHMNRCLGLENWSAVEEDSSILPRLEHLRLDFLKELKKIPFELLNIDTLKSIVLIYCGEGAVKSVKELQGGEDQLSFHVKKLDLKYGDDDDDNDNDDVDSNDEDNVHSDDEDNVDSNDEDNDDMYFLGNMKYLCGLESLSVNGSLQKITYPHSLKKLSLTLIIKQEWGDDMLEKIGSLPLLENLILIGGCFEKGKWEIDQGQFPRLKYLQMSDCGGLENWAAVEEDSYILPRLEHLHLETLYELKKIPFELGNIDTLKSIKLKWCGEGVVKSVKEMFDMQVDLQGGEDQLSFHVQVIVREEHQHLMSLASSNFYVSASW